MLSLIWAFGSTLVLMLILTLLRTGFSFKGKLIVALTSFLLALAGLTAVSSFQLWQTGLILVLLVLAAAYIMETRFASVLYNQKIVSIEEETDEEFEDDVLNEKREKQAELEFMDLKTEEDELTLIMAHDDTNDYFLREQSQDKLETDNLLEETDDFLIVDEPVLQDNTEIIEEKEGYLADIESLLLEESVDFNHTEEDGWLEEINDLEVLTDEDELVKEEKDENLLEELFLAVEEAAAGTEETKKDSDIKREYKLQKSL